MQNPKKSDTKNLKILPNDEATQGDGSSFLGVASVLVALSLFPLAAYYIAIFGRNNSLDHDPVAEVMALLVVLLFGVGILISLTKIQVRLEHSITGSGTTSVLGPVVWHHGHHPPILRFQNHEICFRGKQFCCGCTGASIGILAGGTVIAFIELTDFGRGMPGLLFLGGLILVAIALAPYGVGSNPIPPLRLIMNLILPVGLCFVIASARVNHPTSNLVLLVGGLTFALFLLIRVRLAGRSHIMQRDEMR